MIYTEEHGESLAFMQLSVEEINAPLKVISNYFSIASLPMHRESMETLLLCATTEQQWNLNQQSRMFMRVTAETVKLLEAAYLLQRNKETVFEANSSMANLNDSKGLTINPALYFPPNMGGHSWDYLPKHLKSEEFLNPYLVFDSIFDIDTLAGWRKRLADLIEFALIKNSVFEIGPVHDILKISSLLYKLIEAAHLIDVRENKQSLSRSATA